MNDPLLITRPHITEKSGDLNARGKYVFMVKLYATKPEVKKAVKDVYGVDAVSVRIIRTPGKTKRFRGLPHRTGGLKKAIVTLKEGQKIDLR